MDVYRMLFIRRVWAVLGLLFRPTCRACLGLTNSIWSGSGSSRAGPARLIGQI